MSPQPDRDEAKQRAAFCEIPIPRESTVSLVVNGVAWLLRVLSGDLYVNGRMVPFLVSEGDHTITVTDRTSASHFGAAVLLAMNGAAELGAD